MSINVVQESERPTGRVVRDKGDDEYRRSFVEVFPFAAVDFNKSESRDTGLGLLGLKETVKLDERSAHDYAEPAQCFDPCFEMNKKIAELEKELEFAKWRNE